MPMQDLEQIFNAKINRYEMQGMPLQQAAEMAKNEMRNDPRIRTLMQKNIQQSAQQSPTQNPANINIQQQRTGGGDWKSAMLNSILFGEDGKTMQETDSGGAEIMQGRRPRPEMPTTTSTPTTTDEDFMTFGKEQARKSAEEGTLKDFAYSSDISPILNAKGYYSQAKANAQAQLPPYNPNYAGEAYTAAVPYTGVNIMRKLRGLMDKGNLEKEEQEVLSKIKESLSFKNQLADDMTKSGGGFGSTVDRYGQYKDDKVKSAVKLGNVLGVPLNSMDKTLLAADGAFASGLAVDEGKFAQAKAIINDAASNVFTSMTDWDEGLDVVTWQGFYDNYRSEIYDAYIYYYQNKGEKDYVNKARAEMAKWEQLGETVKEKIMKNQAKFAPYVNENGWDYFAMIRDGSARKDKEILNKAMSKILQAYRIDAEKTIKAIDNAVKNGQLSLEQAKLIKGKF